MKRRGESDTWAEECEGVKWHGRESGVGEEDEQKGAYGRGQPWNTRALAGSLAGTCPVNYSIPLWWGGIEFITSSFFFLLPHFCLGLGRWAICYKCMMNFIKYSQLLLKSLEICTVEPNMPRTDLTHRAEMWNLPEIKSCAGKFRSFMILLLFFPEQNMILLK